MLLVQRTPFKHLLFFYFLFHFLSSLVSGIKIIISSRPMLHFLSRSSYTPFNRAKGLSSPNICATSWLKGWGSWHPIFGILCSSQHFFRCLHPMSWEVKLHAKRLRLALHMAHWVGSQGTLRLKVRRGTHKSVLWSSVAHQGHGSESNQPQNRW